MTGIRRKGLSTFLYDAVSEFMSVASTKYDPLILKDSYKIDRNSLILFLLHNKCSKSEENEKTNDGCYPINLLFSNPSFPIVYSYVSYFDVL